MSSASLHNLPTTWPSGNTPNQPCLGWIIKPHVSTVTLLLDAMYFCIAIDSWCYPQSIGTGRGLMAWNKDDMILVQQLFSSESRFFHI